VAATLPATPYDSARERIQPEGAPPVHRRHAAWPDVLFSVLAHAAAWLTLLLLAGIIASLVVGAMPAIREYGLSFLWRSEWDPVQNRYGGLVMIYGTLMTSAIALLIAVPVSLASRCFLLSCRLPG
jgi:phosphate transport system permease protein